MMILMFDFNTCYSAFSRDNCCFLEISFNKPKHLYFVVNISPSLVYYLQCPLSYSRNCCRFPVCCLRHHFSPFSTGLACVFFTGSIWLSCNKFLRNFFFVWLQVREFCMRFGKLKQNSKCHSLEVIGNSCGVRQVYRFWQVLDFLCSPLWCERDAEILADSSFPPSSLLGSSSWSSGLLASRPNNRCRGQISQSSPLALHYGLTLTSGHPWFSRFPFKL